VDLAAEEDVAALADRPGWTIDGPRATFRLSPTGWSAAVRRVIPAGHTYSTCFVAIIDPSGAARYTKTASRLVDAMVIAERLVRGRPA
jgi:hypothetical protein